MKKLIKKYNNGAPVLNLLGSTKSSTLPNKLSYVKTGISKKANPLTNALGYLSEVGNTVIDVASTIAPAVNTLSPIIPSLDKTVNEKDATSEGFRSTINSSLMSSGNPYLMAAGAINTGIDKLGGYSDASQGLGGTTDTLNMIASTALPGSGWLAGKTMDYKVSNTLKDNAASYGGTLDKANKAAQNAGAKLLFGKNKADNKISDAAYRDTKVQNIINDNMLALAGSNNPLLGLGTQYQLLGGYNQSNVKVGQKGLKLDREFSKKVLKRQHSEDIEAFKEGGKVNVIPSGALHKNKHHLDDIDDKFEEVTAKGIPVITESADGEITQHAEVEKEEIIFNLEVTKELEKLMQDGSDNAAIEAGKLLVKEILENTIDNTGLLKTIE